MSASEKLFRFQEVPLLVDLLGKLVLGGLLAFGLGFSEFLLVSRTSSLTFSISGIFKVFEGGASLACPGPFPSSNTAVKMCVCSTPWALGRPALLQELQRIHHGVK